MPCVRYASMFSNYISRNLCVSRILSVTNTRWHCTSIFLMQIPFSFIHFSFSVFFFSLTKRSRREECLEHELFVSFHMFVLYSNNVITCILHTVSLIHVCICMRFGFLYKNHTNMATTKRKYLQE